MIELLTASTPNGVKASIALEELELPYTVRPIKLGENEQKEEWFLKLNPNGRIPVIIDHDNDDFVVFESGAILIYLAEKTGKLMPTDEKGRSKVLQWLMWQMGGLGPMQGQANVFYRYFPEKIQPAIDRYQKEVRRLYEVMDRQLGETEFLAGDYSIADIASYGWARTHEWAGVDISGIANFQRWLDTMAARPAVQRGLDVPTPQKNDKRTDEQRVKSAANMIVK